MTTLLFLAGGILLLGGAELLVRGASSLAAAAGVTPLVIGLTVVAFGTSAPELAVTLGSARGGAADLALGNVVGSNIFNILFILGLSSLVTPLRVAHQLVRLDVPLMIGASLLVLLLSLDRRVGQLDGAFLFAGALVYTGFLIWQSRRQSRVPKGPQDGSGSPGDGVGKPGWFRNLALVAVGLALLVVGARWLVSAAVGMAEALGVGELVIGLTIVAAGTSLPEVATSVLASVRGHRDIAVGNAVGSCIFNLLVVLGLGSLLSPGGIGVPPGALTFDLPIMIAVALAALPVFFTGHIIARWEGAVFLAYYGAYTVYLILEAGAHASLPAFRAAMAWFILPLTVLTLLILVVRTLQDRPTSE